jgi:hypothetical protein
MAEKKVKHAEVPAEKQFGHVEYKVDIKKAGLTRQQIGLLKDKLKELFTHETAEFSPGATIVVKPKVPPPTLKKPKVPPPTRKK